MSNEYPWTQTEPLAEKIVKAVDFEELCDQMDVQRVASGLAALNFPPYYEAFLIKEPWLQL